jgi:mRNA-degrading endonuclease toxin of MazEF toxin-antitoxin module
VTQRPTYPRGAVVFVDLEPVVGVEQGRERPCIVVSDLETVRSSRARPVYVVVPLTRSETLIGPLAPRLKRREGGLPADSTALVMHVRSIAPERATGRTRGALNEEEMQMIETGLRALLRLA